MGTGIYGKPEVDILELSGNQLYPQHVRNMGSWVIDHDPGFKITKDTAIGSIGSCFAVEIQKWLKQNGYRYVETAYARDGSGPWGKVYNTASLRQIMAVAAGRWETWEHPWWVDNQFVDPLRKWHTYDSWSSYAFGQEVLHRKTVEALQQMDVFIITVGLNEVWGTKDRAEVFYQVPPAEVFDPARHAFWRLTVDDNVNNLHEAMRYARMINPELRFVLTLSPVPLRATFRKDVDCFTANVESKAVLRAALAAFGKLYFPAYEVAMAAGQGMPFNDDARHVRPAVVNAIMEVFERSYVEVV